jgi:hypothetical protein
VVAEIESQVKVLGRGSDIQRAIKIYGRIGEDTEHRNTKTGFVKDEAHPAMRRTMVSLFMDDMMGTTEDVLEVVFLVPTTVVRQTFGFISAHKILLVILVFSVFVNLFLSVRSTVGYWQHRHAERFMKTVGVEANKGLIRMVSLKDIDDLVTKGLIGVNSTADNGLWYL